MGEVVKYNCFTMLYLCLLYNKVNRPNIYVCPLPSESPSVPLVAALQIITERWDELAVLWCDPTSCLFYIWHVHKVVRVCQRCRLHSSHSSPPAPSPHAFLYVCVSAPASRELGAISKWEVSGETRCQALPFSAWFALHLERVKVPIPSPRSHTHTHTPLNFLHRLSDLSYSVHHVLLYVTI